MKNTKIRSWNKFENHFFYFQNGKYFKDSDCKKCVSERICSEFMWSNAEWCTGLHDKNGKEIYTGDILQLKKLDGIVLLYKIFCVKGGFAFNTHQDDFYKPQIEIYFYESTSDMQNSSFISTLEIIGNIFENQELLEKKFAD